MKQLNKRFIFLSLCLQLFSWTNILADTSNEQKIKCYALYTDSHKNLFENYFYPTLMQFNEFDLVVETWNQLCPTGSFMSQGWVDIMHKKMDMFLRATEENWNGWFVFSDVDIQFFAPCKDILEQELEGYDLIIQKENPHGMVCTGFFACRANEKTLALWKYIKSKISPKRHEQDWLNEILLSKPNNQFDIKWKFLPTDSFFGGGTFTGHLWKQGTNLPIPANPIMHHANYVFLQDKEAQLQHVRERVLAARMQANA